MRKQPGKAIGQRLAQIRAGLKVTPQEFAADLGISSLDVLKLWEGSATLPTTEALTRLAEKHPIDLHELLMGCPPPSIQREVEQLRAIKHEFRLLRNELRPHLESLSQIDRQMGEAAQTLDSYIRKYGKGLKQRAGDKEVSDARDGGKQAD